MMKRIVCFGDSNTYGYIPARGGRYDSTARWTGLLRTMLPHCEIVEEGLNGRTTVFDDKNIPGRNGSRALEIVLRDNDPADVILIMLGTNDCKCRFHTDAGMIANGMEILVSQIRLFDPNTRIVIIAPACLTEESTADGSFDQHSLQTAAELRDSYRRLALRTGCGFIPACDSIVPDSADGVHLSPEGHRRLARLVYDYLTDPQK